jgi:hypothetical protein
MANVSFNSDPSWYRIKPELTAVWFVISDVGEVLDFYISEQMAIDRSGDFPGSRAIKFVEEK